MSFLEDEIRKIIRIEIKRYFDHFDLSEAERATISFAQNRGGFYTINELNKGSRKIKSADHARFVTKRLIEKDLAKDNLDGTYKITFVDETIEDVFR